SLSEINKYLPNLVSLSAHVRQITLNIQTQRRDGTIILPSEGPLRANVNNNFSFNVNFRVIFGAPREPSSDCEGRIIVSYDMRRPVAPPSLPDSLAVYTNAGLALSQVSRCTCQQPWSPGLDCTGQMLGVQISPINIPTGGAAFCTFVGS